MVIHRTVSIEYQWLSCVLDQPSHAPIQESCSPMVDCFPVQRVKVVRAHAGERGALGRFTISVFGDFSCLGLV